MALNFEITGRTNAHPIQLQLFLSILYCNKLIFGFIQVFYVG